MQVCRKYPLIEDFLASQKSKKGCWIYPSRPNKDGYVQCNDIVTKYAHRAAYELFKGKIPNGKIVLHKCDNPPCCNPNHLIIGSQQANADDCGRKNRRPYGAKHYNAKLSENQVKKIISSKERIKILSLKYGVSASAIYSIKTRRSWKHV